MAGSDAAPSLGTRLRAETADAHRVAERSPLMQHLLSGQADRLRYARLLQQLLALYGALEHQVTVHAQHPWLAAAWSPGLARHGALQEDLGVLAPPPALALPATQAYLARLADIGADPANAGVRLLAHVYVRHLGDLSGGQILRRTLARAFGLPVAQAGPLAGLHFLDFGDAAAALQARLRAALTALPDSGADADATVDEAVWAFAQHQRLFDELVTEAGA